MILTQLRCSTSFLNNDIYKSNIILSPNCACGVPREDAYHFFIEYSKYTDIRRDLLICVPYFMDYRSMGTIGRIAAFRQNFWGNTKIGRSIP